jgi:hypothetical protein
MWGRLGEKEERTGDNSEREGNWRMQHHEIGDVLKMEVVDFVCRVQPSLDIKDHF